MHRTDTAVKGPLVTNGKFPHTPEHQRRKRQDENRVHRYALQSKMQWGLLENRGARACIRCRKNDANAISIERVRRPDGTIVAFYGNVQKCGSIWLCPVCSNKIRGARAKEMTASLSRHIDSGRGALASVLTLSHHRGNSLSSSLSEIKSAWSKMTRHRYFKAWRERYGVIGYIKSLEVTNGQNGWHPHYHFLWLTKEPIDKYARYSMETDLFAIWSKYVTNHTDRSVTRQANGIEQIKSGQAIGRYLAKTIAYELTHGHMKDGKKSGQRTPFQIANDYFQTGDSADEALWREYEQAIKGEHFITWSPSLKHLRTDARTDLEIAEAKVQGERLEPSYLPEVYRANGHQTSLHRGALLNIAQNDGPMALHIRLQEIISRQDE